MKISYIALGCTILLFFIPFFWLAPGQMDLGGDSNRLYFYDPVAFNKFTSQQMVTALGMGAVEPNFFYLPYVGMLAILHTVISPTYLIALINGLKLAIGFFAVYRIVVVLLEHPVSKLSRRVIHGIGIASGLLYTSAFATYHMATFWNRAITSHNQVFLNPLMFLLLLQFFVTEKSWYLWLSILVTGIFSPNFSLTSAPPFFAFYPLAVVFLSLYSWRILHKLVPVRRVLGGLVLFFGIQSFHLIPQLMSLFDPGSFVHGRLFDESQVSAGADYFMAVHGLAKASISFLLPVVNSSMSVFFALVPAIIIAGFIIQKKKHGLHTLVAVFFLITYCLTTAVITKTGLNVYRQLFAIPGFSMFRNFYTQWHYVYLFFYALLFGLSLSSVVALFKSFAQRNILITLVIALILAGLPLYSGSLITKRTIVGSRDVPVVFEMDPIYEDVMSQIAQLPEDGKIMVLPLTDYYYQVIPGKNGGAYEGPSTLYHLAGKYSFVGYQEFGYAPTDYVRYAEDLMQFSYDEEYDKLLTLFNTLNIRYILHNEDPRAYEAGYDPGPYGYMMTKMPKTQSAYKDYLSHFPLEVVYQNGPYTLYRIDDNHHNPTIFSPREIVAADEIDFNYSYDDAVFISPEICARDIGAEICEAHEENVSYIVSYEEQNPALYTITVQSSGEKKPLFLVMQHTYHPGWKLYYADRPLAENAHVLVNGYANGWLVATEDIPDADSFTLSIALEPQKNFRYGMMISVSTLIITGGLFGYSLWKRS